MRGIALTALGTLAVSLGCRRTAAPQVSTDASSTVPSYAAPAVDATTETGVPATEPAILGGPCKEASQDIWRIVCVNGRVAGVYARLGTVEQGDGYDVLYSGEPKVSGDGRGIRHLDSHLEVLVRGDVLVIHQKDCGRCVAVMGWTFTGSLAKLRDADLRALACRVLGSTAGGSDLRSARIWQSLLDRDGPDAGAPSPECANAATF